MRSLKFLDFFVFLLIIAITCFKEPFSSASILEKELLANGPPLHDEFNDLSAFSLDLVKALSIHLKKIPLPLLKQKVKTQVARAAENLDLPNPEEESCELNYSELCPFQWINAGDGESCMSPYEYTGPCKKLVSFKNATSVSKEKFASECKVSWPCINDCIRDYSKECPEGWTLDKESIICEAPLTYDGGCIKKKNFTFYTKAEKVYWEKECNVKWSCFNQNYDFHFLCPLNWIENPDQKSCSAPDSYVGPCPYSLFLYDMKNNEKITLMKICNIEWPRHQIKNLYDFNASLCPIGWSLQSLQEERCSAPTYYNGPCQKSVSFLNFSNEEKYDFSKKCDVQWKTLDQKRQNYDLPCPYNWELVNEKEHVCIAPEEYDGLCENIVSFKNYSKEMKAEWANACGTVFSIGEIGDLQEWKGGKGGVINKKRKNLKIFGKSVEKKNEVNLSINNGPIGTKGSEYEGEVLNADDETVYAPSRNYSSINRQTSQYKNETSIEIENIGNKDDTDFIVTDDKIKDLMLLKAASDDEQFRATVEETIQELKRKIHQTGYSFVEIRRVEGKSDDIRSDDIKSDDIKSDDIRTDDIRTYDIRTDDVETNPRRHLNGHLKGQEQNLKKNNRIEKAEEKEKEKNINKVKLYDIRNLYENYKIENANFLYNEDICLEKDYTKCPIGWSRLNNKECLAPTSYIRNIKKCTPILNIKNIVKNVYSVYHDMTFVTIDIDKMMNLEKICNISFPCKECEQDYVKINCPLGWKELSNGSCKAPIDYPDVLKKKCGSVVNFAFATPVVKRNWSLVCKFRWPCVSACEKNYSAICPVGYTLINKRKEQYEREYGKEETDVYVCTKRNWIHDDSILSYKKKKNFNLCKVIEVFDSLILKKEIEKKCKVIWPCLNKCEEDFYQTCPYNWMLKNNKCIAPYFYQPPKGCSTFFDVLSFSSLDKSIISNKCFAPWPCKTFCQQDYSGYCPDGWMLHKMDMNKKGKDIRNEKKKDEPFFSEKKYNTKKKTRYLCMAPHNYDGTCHRQQDFTDYTFLQKQDFAFRCSVQWPCGQKVYNTENWQKENIYKDANFAKLKTLRFYDTAYAKLYNKNRDSFFSFH